MIPSKIQLLVPDSHLGNSEDERNPETGLTSQAIKLFDLHTAAARAASKKVVCVVFPPMHEEPAPITNILREPLTEENYQAHLLNNLRKHYKHLFEVYNPYMVASTNPHAYMTPITNIKFSAWARGVFWGPETPVEAFGDKILCNL